MRALLIVVLVVAAGAGGLALAKTSSSDAPASPAPVAASPAAPVSVTIVAAAEDEDAAVGDDEGDEEEEQVIPLEDIPAVVLEAAKQACPGLVPDSAELDTSSGETVYDVHGLVDGKTWEVEVSAAGMVLGSELDDD
jgi:uncharacterized membrane protein YkoI